MLINGPYSWFIAFKGVIRKAKDTGYKFAKALPATIAINVPKIEPKVGINPIFPPPRKIFALSFAIVISQAFKHPQRIKAIIIPKIEAITEMDIASIKKSFLHHQKSIPQLV